MGYYYTAEPETAVPAKSDATPKTHTPGSRVSERGQRYFMSSIGRWASRDPIGEKGGIDLYSFTRNQPASLYDAHGLEGCTVSDPQLVFQFSATHPSESFDWWSLRDAAFENHVLTYKCKCKCGRERRHYNETITCSKYKVHTSCEFSGASCSRNVMRTETDHFYWEGAVSDRLVGSRTYTGDSQDFVIMGTGEWSETGCFRACEGRCEGMNGGGLPPAPLPCDPRVLTSGCEEAGRQRGQ